MKKNIFISKMKLFEDTNESLAQFIGISQSRLSAKINSWNGAEFTQSEIQKIKDRYNLTVEEMSEIFFTAKVSKLDTNKESEDDPNV
ncbi:hypothetical protein FACS1894217_05130 [Clostridia bacterium]|nr:hypothetical protein FACS1894217_05130 [Clostridia bacterium]